jgi:hypothetical protein
MIRSSAMTSDDASRTRAATDSGARGAIDAGAGGAAGAGANDDAASEATADGRPRPRRELNRVDWLVRVPIGLLWLGVLAILAVPVMIYMTLFYWGARWTSSLFGRSRAGRTDRSDREERVA